MEKHILSKSTFIRGTQCLKSPVNELFERNCKFWLDWNGNVNYLNKAMISLI